MQKVLKKSLSSLQEQHNQVRAATMSCKSLKWWMKSRNPPKHAMTCHWYWTMHTCSRTIFMFETFKTKRALKITTLQYLLSWIHQQVKVGIYFVWTILSRKKLNKDYLMSHFTTTKNTFNMTGLGIEDFYTPIKYQYQF